MELGKMKCFRCKGQKKMYKLGKSGFSLMNSGGVQVECPLCLGEGFIKTLDQVSIELNDKKFKSRNIKTEGIKNATKAS